MVNRKSETSADGQAFVLSELNRIKRLSQGKVKMIETGTGDTEVVTAFIKRGENEITGKHRVLVYLVPFSGPAGDLIDVLCLCVCLCVCLCLHLYLCTHARESERVCVRERVCVCVCVCVYFCDRMRESESERASERVREDTYLMCVYVCVCVCA